MEFRIFNRAEKGRGKAGKFHFGVVADCVRKYFPVLEPVRILANQLSGKLTAFYLIVLRNRQPVALAQQFQFGGDGNSLIQERCDPFVTLGRIF